ncbi:MAG: glycosyltransferase family 4 protein [Oribacterium sp.]|nr:glycosyltransferase family 4 protein [Oribacterium sp.]
MELIKLSDVEIAGVVDSNPNRCGAFINGYEILAVDQIKNCTNEYVCVTFFGENDYEPVWEELVERYSISKNRLLSFQSLIKIIYQRLMMIPLLSVNNTCVKAIISGAWAFGVGGVETWINETFSVLTQQNKNVYLLTKANQYSGNREGFERVIDFSIKDSCSFKINEVERTKNELINLAPCVIICSRADEVLLAASLLHKANPTIFRIIVVIHGSCDGIIRDFFAYNEEIEKYLCVSSPAQNALVALGVEKERTEIIISPIIDLFNKKRNYSLNKEKPIRIGYAGRIEVFHKRADLLILLIKELEQRNVNYYFEIVGDGSFVPNLKNFIENNNLSGKINYKGLLDRKYIFDFWRDKDIAINVSDSEGRPISNIEAMISGAVPVVTRSVGILDDVINGVTGYTVDIGDMENMARVIECMSNNRNSVKEIGEKAEASMRKKTDIQAYVYQWNEILKGR